MLPQFDSASRTLKVRLEMANQGMLFRPDMFVEVEFPANMPPTVTVPSEAVVDSGLRKTVYVERGYGLFEPREIEVGAAEVREPQERQHARAVGGQRERAAQRGDGVVELALLERVAATRDGLLERVGIVRGGHPSLEPESAARNNSVPGRRDRDAGRAGVHQTQADRRPVAD